MEYVAFIRKYGFAGSLDTYTAFDAEETEGGFIFISLSLRAAKIFYLLGVTEFVRVVQPRERALARSRHFLAEQESGGETGIRTRGSAFGRTTA